MNIGLPKILATFNVDVQQGHWVITGYMIALAVVIPISGYLSEKIGMKRLYMSTMALFIVGSLLCSIAWDLPSLIVFRVLQGLGGGMLHPLGLAISYSLMTPLERPRFMALLGLPSLVAPLLGPVAGGYLVDYISWHAMFSFNIPIAVVGLVLAGLLLRETRRATRRASTCPGFILSTIAFPALLLGFSYGARDGWTAPMTGLFLVVGLSTFLAWIVVELIQPGADARPAAVRERRVQPQHWPELRDPAIAVRHAATRAAVPADRPGARGIGSGPDLDAAGGGVVPVDDRRGAGVQPHRPAPAGADRHVRHAVDDLAARPRQPRRLARTIAWLAVARGFSLGFCFMPVQTAAYNTVPQRQLARATALYNGLLRIFASFATAFLSTMLAARSLFHYSALASAITPTAQPSWTSPPRSSPALSAWASPLPRRSSAPSPPSSPRR